MGNFYQPTTPLQILLKGSCTHAFMEVCSEALFNKWITNDIQQLLLIAAKTDEFAQLPGDLRAQFIEATELLAELEHLLNQVITEWINTGLIERKTN